ncbi:glycosyltransferase, MGT family [Beutenbergia cavernae DSM 12333]|uniref:Glycosyltransferase, MGT family n=1 Tax=Beutenbergia cavernae (strain ATCC BAA-8 / DSM 12333 / CCUG 43141 / JCM 11478 / NBRC 16432 / NCIMB 13614 / HKI 0122) TaxID=471853 RepID=C5C2F4_BEUC1|nr:glycosyltransferase, MGT family [Beutenbergia cavernae DSM 12333]
MRGTYLFALTEGGGTVPPEIGVARRLIERGHRVIVLAEDASADDVRAAGAELVGWKKAPNRRGRSRDDDPLHDWELRDPISLARGMAEHMLVGPAPGQADDVASLIARELPDLVVTSFPAWGAMVAAEASGTPFDVLMPNVYPLPAPGLPQLGTGMRPARGPLGRARDRAATAVSTRLLDRFTLERLTAVRRDHGLAPLSHSWDQVRRARRQLVLTSRAFDFQATLPPGVRYCGPILDEPAWAGADGWTAPPGHDPLVLVAMSSTFQDQVACLQRVVDALGRMPVRGVVTTGPALDTRELHAPANVSVVPAAPHREVMREAALVVTHGGHGTVMKALAADLPLLLLPHGRDQADNAVRVTSRGAGLTLRRGAPSRRIAAAVRRLLDDPSYARGAARLGALVRRDASGDGLVTELEQTLAQASPGGAGTDR